MLRLISSNTPITTKCITSLHARQKLHNLLSLADLITWLSPRLVSQRGSRRRGSLQTVRGRKWRSELRYSA